MRLRNILQTLETLQIVLARHVAHSLIVENLAV